MSRRGSAKKETMKFDPFCRSRVVNMLVNRMMKHGKKSLAYQIFYRAGIDIRQQTTNKTKSSICFTSSNK